MGLNKDYSLPLNIFKHINISDEITLDENTDKILSVVSHCDIIEKSLVKTPKGQSYDGSILSGLSLIINGIITTKVEYTCLIENNDYITYIFKTHFSTDLIIPYYLTSCNILLETLLDNINCIKTYNSKVFFNYDIIINCNVIF